MKLSTVLISVGIAAAVIGCSSQIGPEKETSDVVSDVAIEENVATSDERADIPAGAEIDPAAIEAALAQLGADNTLPEIELDEAAMADFLETDMATTETGLQYLIEEEGAGAIPEAGEVVQLHYTGKLADGTVFDSSHELDEPIAFPLGQGFVIPGWDEGVSLLPVGSSAKFIIPPELAYDVYGVPGVIPPNATLYFEMELLDILPGSPEAPTTVAETDFISTKSGLKYHDLVEGDGMSPEEGQWVSIHYTGWLEDGTKFDSSLDRGMPMDFPIGAGYTLPGFDEGLSTMKVGGRRQLVIPAELAFGEAGAADIIPPNTSLIVEIELLEVQS